MRLYAGLLSSLTLSALVLFVSTTDAAVPSDSTSSESPMHHASGADASTTTADSTRQSAERSERGGASRDVGIYVAPQVTLASNFDDTAVMVGGRMAFVFNGVISLGGAGVRLVNDLALGENIDGRGEHLDMTYGGAVLGATPWTDAGLHPTLDLLIGGGRLQFDPFSPRRVSDGFLVIDATAGLEMNVVEGIRLNVSGGYRHTAGVSLQGITDDHLRGAVGTATLRFGAF